MSISLWRLGQRIAFKPKILNSIEPQRRSRADILVIIVSVGAIQAVAALATVLRGKYVALVLGPGGVGITSVIDQWAQSLAYVAALSLPLVSTRFLSQAHSEGPGAFRTVYAMFLKGLLVLSGTASIGAAIVAAWRPQWFGDALAGYRSALVLALLVLPCAILNGFFSSLLAAAQKPKASAALVLAANLALGIAACTGLYLGGIPGMYAGSACGGLALIIGSASYIRKTMRLPFYVRGVSLLKALRHEREIVLFSALQFAATLGFSIALLVVRSLVLNELGATESGFLQSQMAVSQAISLVLSPPTFAVLMPIVNRRIENIEKINATNAYLEQFASVLVLLALALIAFPRTALVVLFTSRFLPAADTLFVFVLYVCILLVAGIYQTLLIGLGDMWGYFWATLLGQASVCALAVATTSIFGTAGSGLALLGGSVIILGGCLLRLRLKFSMPVAPRSLYAAFTGFVFLGAAGWVSGCSPELAVVPLLVRGLLLLIAALTVFGLSARSLRKPAPAL